MVCAGIYHIGFGVWANLVPYQAFEFCGLGRPDSLMLWRVLGLVSGVLGVAFLIAAKNPIRHWLLVLAGLTKSVFASGIVIFTVSKGELPPASLLILLVNDVIWLAPFSYILWAALRAYAGIPPSRNQPFSVNEAANTYKLSNGETLQQAAAERPLALVFLRHFGCTFTRQLLQGLQNLDAQARANGAQLVLVHMLQSGQEIRYLGRNSEIPRIADPRCELYRAFGLGKGGFLELFGPQVWWRGAISVFKGCGLGHLAGDGLQMPGAFIFHQGQILSAQPASSAADLPDLAALFQETANEAQPLTP